MVGHLNFHQMLFLLDVYCPGMQNVLMNSLKQGDGLIKILLISLKISMNYLKEQAFLNFMMKSDDSYWSR